MDRNLVGGLATAVGVVLLLLSALADQVGIGDTGFGGQQALGVIVGAVVAVVGMALTYLERGEARRPLPH